MKMKAFVFLFALIAGLSSVNAADYVWLNRTSKTGVMMKTPAVSFTRVTLTGLVANVTTVSVSVTTGNVNIPVTVNGYLMYIKANPNP